MSCTLAGCPPSVATARSCRHLNRRGRAGLGQRGRDRGRCRLLPCRLPPRTGRTGRYRGLRRTERLVGRAVRRTRLGTRTAHLRGSAAVRREGGIPGGRIERAAHADTPANGSRETWTWRCWQLVSGLRWWPTVMVRVKVPLRVMAHIPNSGLSTSSPSTPATCVGSLVLPAGCPREASRAQAGISEWI